MTQTSNQSSERSFKKVSGGSNGTPWKPHMTEANFMKMGDDPVKEGYLLSSRIVNGKEKPFEVFSIQEVNPDGTFGQVYEVIGDTVLLDKFKAVPFGSYIRAEYKGRIHKKAIREVKGYHPGAPFTQTNSFHNWEVGVDENAIPYAEAAKMMGAKVTTTQTPVNTPKPNIEDVPFTEDDSDLPF